MCSIMQQAGLLISKPACYEQNTLIIACNRRAKHLNRLLKSEELLELPLSTRMTKTTQTRGVSSLGSCSSQPIAVRSIVTNKQLPHHCRSSISAASGCWYLRVTRQSTLAAYGPHFLQSLFFKTSVVLIWQIQLANPINLCSPLVQ